MQTHTGLALQVRLEFKLADLWVGAFWARRNDGLHVWICLLPCLPIHIVLKGETDETDQ